MPNIIAAVSDHDDDISDLVGYQDISGQNFLMSSSVRSSEERLGLWQIAIR